MHRTEPPPHQAYDAIVIGGGFYGARTALALDALGAAVLLLEAEPALLGRASLVNQARVHGGYHYPRSLLTSLRSRVNYARFVGEYGDCLVDDFTHYYAIAGDASRVTAAQFTEFCRRIGAPLDRAPRAIRSQFAAMPLIDDVFRVTECAFDATALRRRVASDLAASNVCVECSARVVHCALPDDGAAFAVSYEREGTVAHALAQHVFNCSYASLNTILQMVNAAPIPIKREVAEMALVRLPPSLTGSAVTVMDGPFFSVVPYPPRPGLSTLSHVRYTPHTSTFDNSSVLAARSSRFAHMVRDAARYLPAMRDAEYVESIWETKAILPRSEQDDSRPILFRPSPECPRLVSILGAKIDGVYDVEERLVEYFGATAAAVNDG